MSFRTPASTEGIIPSRLRRVWEVDNKKQQVLWEMGNVGGVSGDCFVKVAYEEPWVDPIGMRHPGRVRILPLNSAYCFPEWHPHDRTRLIRFKLKYRFWGTSAEGTRQVFTYTELITDTAIEEYVNDELVDQRPNPLGRIPIVHIANVPVSGSPWGLADIHDLTSLNREFNEKATDLSDIINYYAAPVTVITGAKASNLERGPKKVWGGLPKDAQVFNLNMEGALTEPLNYLNMIKMAMHELMGVPESALGQMQPISNTAGVALAIMYQPTMMKYQLKTTQYGAGIEQVNELVILTLAIKEPWTLMWDPELDAEELKPGQLQILDPTDPITYRTFCHWEPPLPVDILVKLNEVMMKMQLGLESKRGALRDLGEQFPDEKMEEIFNELLADAEEQGAIDLRRSLIQSAIMTLTGMPPAGADGAGAGGPSVTSAGGGDVTSAGQATVNPFASVATMEEGQVMQDLVTKSYGTKAAQRRSPEND